MPLIAQWEGAALNYKGPQRQIVLEHVPLDFPVVTVKMDACSGFGVKPYSMVIHLVDVPGDHLSSYPHFTVYLLHFPS